MANPKDIVYIDVDEEITGIIDKVLGSKEKIVALVLPKRAAVLQSIVNMKLLKKSSDDAKKHIVLITSDNNLLPLAGTVGFYVAKTLQTRPVVPPSPSAVSDDATVSVSEDAEFDDDEIDTSKPVGALAGIPSDEDEEIEVGDDDEVPDDAPTALEAAATEEGKKFNKKLKVPNFERFRILLMLGVVLLIGLGVGAYFALTKLPKASITIKTDTTNINTDVAFTASTTAQTVDMTQMILPATQKQVIKTDKQQVAATGTKDQGTKAGGTLTLVNCIKDDQSHTIPAGTGFSAGQFTFITNKDLTLDPSSYTGGGTCKSIGRIVDVTAAQPGDSYNLSSRGYNSPISGITAQGSNMSGGVSKIVKTVAQADIDSAKQKVLDAAGPTATTDLKQQFSADGGIAFPDTVANEAPKLVTSANVGDEADQVSVTVTITYTMVGIKKSDLSALLDADISKHIDTGKQKISNNGLDQANIKVVDKTKPTAIRIDVQTVGVAGAEQNADAIRKLVAGKKSGDAKSAIKARPGIEEVTVKLSPFWVTKVPGNAKRVTVTFQSNNGSK